MSVPTIVAYLFAMGLLHYQANCKEITILESLDRLISNRPTHRLWIPSIAYADDPKNEYQQIQFDKDRKYEIQVELTLAELQVQLLGSAEAQELFPKAALYGLPSFDNLRFFDNFIVSYDNRLKQPTWSMEYYYGKKMAKYGRLFRVGQFYFPDLAVHQYFRPSDQDYETSNLFRGHFSAAFYVPTNRRIMQQSFLSSNAAPMMHNIYRVNCLWARIESYCTFIARRSKNAHIITGALYQPVEGKVSYATIGNNRIAVPSHFYKIILHESKAGTLLIEAFLAPNAEGPDDRTRLYQSRTDVITDLPEIERLTGLRFFDLLNRAHILKPNCFKYGFIDRLPRKK